MAEVLTPEKLHAVLASTAASWSGAPGGKMLPLQVDTGKPALSPALGLAETALDAPSLVTVAPHSWLSAPWLLGWPRWVWLAAAGLAGWAYFSGQKP